MGWVHYRLLCQALFIGATLMFWTTSASTNDAVLDEASITAIQASVQSNPYRKDNDLTRDRMRHPIAFMTFLGLKPTMKVGEVNPGGQWYSRILGPFLKNSGTYVGMEHHPDQYARAKGFAATLRAYPGKLNNNRDVFGPNAIATWIPASEGLPVEAGSLDAVVAIRALHNWVRQDFFDTALEQTWQILKPGGVFGVIQHRANEDETGDRIALARRGRWKQSDLIAAVESAGFKLVDQSEMNANPRDTKDYIHGVWTLPPILAMGDEGRDKYLDIGESDRMTLKFVKIER